MKILKEITELQTVIICDAWFEDRDEAFSITDDECDFVVRNANKTSKTNVHSLGFVHILTKEEFIEHINSEHFKMYCSQDTIEHQYVVLNNFVGNIGLLTSTSDGQEGSNFDVDDYIQHQFDDWVEVIVEVSAGYEVESVPLPEALKLIESDKGSKLSDKLSEDEKNQLFGEIESEGLGYWLQNYGYKGDEDEELKELCKEGKIILNKVQKRLMDLGVEC